MDLTYTTTFGRRCVVPMWAIADFCMETPRNEFVPEVFHNSDGKSVGLLYVYTSEGVALVRVRNISDIQQQLKFWQASPRSHLIQCLVCTVSGWVGIEGLNGRIYCGNCGAKQEQLLT